MRPTEPSRYGARFYEYTRSEAQRSAEAIVPCVIELVRPSSVIDIGCGLGTWLRAFQDAGVSDVFGIDGPWVDTSQLVIPRERFQAHDLTAPFELGRTFDLVLSLEVAEHLPEESAARFITSLTSLGDVVLFSAAIPGQGGDHHLNEQWPSYWARHFRSNDFMPVDCIRFRFWDDTRVATFYAQNMFLAVRSGREFSIPGVRAWLEQNRDLATRIIDVAHPRLWTRQIRPPAARYSAPTLAKALTKRMLSLGRIRAAHLLRSFRDSNARGKSSNR